MRRAYYWCPACGQGWRPLDGPLGVCRDSHSPGVRRAIGLLGALLPFTQAVDTLAEVAGVQTSPSTVRSVIEAVGGRREEELERTVATAWRNGLPQPESLAPARLFAAMDGLRILGTGGESKKVGVVHPERRTQVGELVSAAASFAPAGAFGPRLALEAHRCGLEVAAEVVVLGDGAAWIWNLIAEHFPGATQIVDWYPTFRRSVQNGKGRNIVLRNAHVYLRVSV